MPPDRAPGWALAPRTSGASSSTGWICSNIGSAAAAETKAPVIWVTEVSSMVTEVLKVRNAPADMLPRAGPASSMNMASEHSGR